MLDNFGTGTGPVCVFTDVSSPGARTRLPLEQTQDVARHLLQTHAPGQFIFHVGEETLDNLEAVRRRACITRKAPIDIRQQPGIVISLASDHYPVNMLKVFLNSIQRFYPPIDMNRQ